MSISSSPDVLLGAQHPRVAHVPGYDDGSWGDDAVELCRSAGLVLDPWQEYVLRESLGMRDGRWSAFEVGLVCPRQNGKGSVLEARELVGLFLLGEQLIIHSAHQFDTSLEHFRRLLSLIEDTPDLDRLVRRVSRSHGEEGIELRTGSRIRFRTRTKGGGRGFTGDCLILDEAMILPETAHGALLPTLSARPNPQVWYAATAVDQLYMLDGLVLARLRERALAGDDDRLAWFEWGLDAPSPEALSDAELADPANWALANPGLGIRIRAEYVDAERRSMEPRRFAVERLGVGDWPTATSAARFVIDPERWARLADARSTMVDPIVLAYDVSPERDRAAIAACGKRSDGRLHVEIVERQAWTDWVAPRLTELVAKHRPSLVVCDGVGPAAALVHELGARGVQVRTLSTPEYVTACGMFFDAVERQQVRHLGNKDLAGALRGAARRPLGDAWAWSRRASDADITPLVAATLALWGIARHEPRPQWGVVT